MKNPILVLGGIVVLGVLLPTILSIVSYDNKTEIKEEKNIKIENKQVVNYEKVNKKSPIIEVYNHKLGVYQSMDIEDYLCGVLAGEMSSEFDIEALKAQAVVARTFVVYKQKQGNPKQHKNAPVCTNYKHCQEYKSYKELKKVNGDKWIEKSYPKIEQAVKETKGQIITYNAEAIQALYFSTASGKTENSEDVFSTSYPYLKSVESKYDTISPKYKSELEISKDKFIEYMTSRYSDIQLSNSSLDSQVKILKRSEGGAIDLIQIGNKELSGRDLRNIFSLNSANFNISINDNNVIFNVIGYGHGVGMSQWGAEGMAKEGYKYYDILLHYYTDTEITDIY